jgi:hypothetical protein
MNFDENLLRNEGIAAYDSFGFEYLGSYRKGPHLLTPSSCQPLIDINDYHEYLKSYPLDAGLLFVIGTNHPIKSHLFHEWTLWALERQCSFEWQPYEAACRMINILREEQRQFLCLLIPPEETKQDHTI